MADQLGTTDAASSQMVQRLVNMGLVKRIESPEDRRAKQISLTEKGKQVVGTMVENRHELIENIVNNIPFEKRQTTIEAISLLVQSAKAYENNMINNNEKE
jgi:DNA-binding MarR family transcriptional regulator